MEGGRERGSGGGGGGGGMAKLERRKKKYPIHRQRVSFPKEASSWRFFDAQSRHRLQYSILCDFLRLLVDVSIRHKYQNNTT